MLRLLRSRRSRIPQSWPFSGLPAESAPPNKKSTPQVRHGPGARLQGCGINTVTISTAPPCFVFQLATYNTMSLANKLSIKDIDLKDKRVFIRVGMSSCLALLYVISLLTI